MCFFSSKSPPVPELPAPPPPIPTEVDPRVKNARQKNRNIAALAEGRDSTILTTSQGLTTPAYTTKKTLLGQ